MLTAQNIDLVYGVLMDSALQNELHEPDHPDAWMLAYVYDTSKIQELDIAREKFELEKSTERAKSGTLQKI